MTYLPFIVILALLSPFMSFAEDSTAGNKPQVPLVDGISARLIPVKSQTITFPETYFSFGIYREFLTQETKDNYYPSGYGVILGFQQHIRGMWSGGVELRWSDWKVKDSKSSLTDTSPLSLFSKVEASPDLHYFHKDNLVASMVRPFIAGGFGYTLFFDDRSPLATRSKTAIGQVSATAGCGIRLILPTSFSVKIGIEEWRGIMDSNYFSNIAFVQLSFGDVDKF